MVGKSHRADFVVTADWEKVRYGELGPFPICLDFDQPVQLMNQVKTLLQK